MATRFEKQEIVNSLVDDLSDYFSNTCPEIIKRFIYEECVHCLEIAVKEVRRSNLGKEMWD
mgnify:CR=1 FL=1